MKKNNKGFFLVEAVVIITLVATVMAFVYPNIGKLYENYTNMTKFYDQTEDLYTLRAYNEKIDSVIKQSTCSNNALCDINENLLVDSENNTYGCKMYYDGNIEDIKSSEVLLVKGNGTNIFGDITKLYITSYLADLSSDDKNFNRYLKRLKKTTNDAKAYRLIGVFEKIDNDGNTYNTYASIKINNPNPNNSCN